MTNYSRERGKKAAAMKQVQLAYSAKDCKKLLEKTLQNKWGQISGSKMFDCSDLPLFWHSKALVRRPHAHSLASVVLMSTFNHCFMYRCFVAVARYSLRNETKFKSVIYEINSTSVIFEMEIWKSVVCKIEICNLKNKKFHVNIILPCRKLNRR